MKISFNLYRIRFLILHASHNENALDDVLQLLYIRMQMLNLAKSPSNLWSQLRVANSCDFSCDSNMIHPYLPEL